MPGLSSRHFNHVGVGVPDVEAAIEWYRKVFGFRLVSGPNHVQRTSASGEQARDVLGSSFGEMWQAHMVTADGIGIEFFQLIDPPHERRKDEIEFWRNGIFHFCITDPEIEDAVRRITEAGGKQLSRIWLERPPSPNHKMVYCADPFGTVIEIYTHSYEDMQGREA